MTTTLASSNNTTRSGLLTISDGEFARIRTLIHDRFGIYLADGKKLLVQGRLNKELKSKGYDSFDAYITDIENEADTERLLGLIDRISTNHSFFFREADHFEFLVDTIFPEFLRAGIEPEDLRIWSAGAADGQEAYTAAMVMHEFFGPSTSWRQPVILATDISVTSLDQASEALYPEAALAAVPQRYRKYFTPTGSQQVRISDEIRKMVMFKRLNLNQPNYPFRNRFHLIFCRNVMIYFDQNTKSEMAKRFSQYTLPEGYLLIGHSESLGRDASGFRYIRPTVYQRWQ